MLFESVAASLIAALLAYRLRYLTLPAALAAALLGSVIVVCGGWDWGVATAGSFVATAVIADRWSRAAIATSSRRDAPRNLTQVVANGVLLALCALAYRLCGQPLVLVAAFSGSVGAVAGDTWASSSGLFCASQPRLLTSGQHVPAGTPGAITTVGVALSAAAGVFAVALYLIASIILERVVSVSVSATLAFAAVFGAVAGSLFDSYLGAARQAVYADARGRLTDQAIAQGERPNRYVRGWRWLTNDLINFFNAVAGAVAAALVWQGAAWLAVV